LPPGTFLNGLSLGGNFSQAGQYSFVVTILDSLGARSTVSAGFNVLPHISITDPFSTKGSSSAGTLSPPDIPITGGMGTVTVAWSGTSPNGFAASVIGSNVHMTLVPLAAPPGSYTFMVTVTDSGVCGPAPGQRCSSNSTVTITMGR
jgi:hypothetical protein